MDGSQLLLLVSVIPMVLSFLTVTWVWFFVQAPLSTPLEGQPLPPRLAQGSDETTAVRTVAAPASTPVPVVVPVVPERSWFMRLSDGLARTRSQISRSLDEFMLDKASRATRAETLENLFETLIRADVGVATSERLVADVQARLGASESTDPAALRAELRAAVLDLFEKVEMRPTQGTLEKPGAGCHVIMMVGVNGVGKTTTTGKLAHKARARGMGVVVGAADTFRAAAVEQLAVWADRSGASLVRLKEGSDPASVAFETVRLAHAQGAGLALIDTAGRLHNRADLMQELAKIKRVMAKEIPEAPHEVLLVVDATTGQNALQQARVFGEIAGVTGVVLTKLDGTAKGGVALALVSELRLPIRYIGVGESVDDLEPFSAREFTDALFS